MRFKLHQANGALNSPAIFSAVEHGIRAAGYSVTNDESDIEVIWSVLWQGRMKPNQLIYEQCLKNNKPVMIIEVGNLIRGQTWRLSFNNINGLGNFANTHDLDQLRGKKLGVLLHPKRISRSNKILLACQHEHSLQWQGQPRMHQWVEQTIECIRKYSDRKIVVRPHPRSPFSAKLDNIEMSYPKAIKGSYDSYDFVDDFYCVINHNSGPAIQAAIHGTPVITHSSSLAHPVSGVVENIESIQVPDREDWFLKLCHTEWTVSEIMSGMPIRRLVESLD